MNLKKGRKGVRQIVAIAFLKSLHLILGLSALAEECLETNALLNFFRARLQKRKFSKPIRENGIIFLMGFFYLRSDLPRLKMPLMYSAFLRYWREEMPTLKIFLKGTDFCDICATTKKRYFGFKKFRFTYR